MALSLSKAGSVKALQKEFKSLNDCPVEGFLVKIKNESNMFEWDVIIFGPPGTLYEGGYLKLQLMHPTLCARLQARLKFPNDYPYSPPSMVFVSKMWHPNIYSDGRVCISILHPPGDDPVSGELPSERWNPTQNVRTILLSVISLLNEPNTCSPANVDASVMYRKWKEAKDAEYERIVRQQVEATKMDAQADGVVVPTCIEDYVIKASVRELTPLSQDVFGIENVDNNLDDDITIEYDEDDA